MTDRISLGQLYPHSVHSSIHRAPGHKPAVSAPRLNTSFQELLDKQSVKFSHHAETRLKQRGINIGPDQLSKLANAVDKAAAKGANDSLILMGNLALIVNIHNRTVVTAMDQASMKNNVFTDIDSAIIVMP
ncbi:TIGR02530 family flagellar biosynthesis protein [Paenibacillus senegalensis]|uniref:TIGR02530 family flagellar biosynthesis protein n=1 Tax=Paenibacillus senegalensis TaxID=1465766 RepID=UPI0002884445|nr:TIGR02530 family flagellar biosynthesis protein [Paenibacillus senegalensis]